MTVSKNWTFPAALQPQPEQVPFDLRSALQSVVMVHAEIPEAAFTAPLLGTERIGSGVVISDDGMVLTIGYLVTEAHNVWLSTHNGRAVPGHVVGYDQTSGFGLVQPLGDLGVPLLAWANIGHGGHQQAYPIGIAAELDANARTLRLLDPPLLRRD